MHHPEEKESRAGSAASDRLAPGNSRHGRQRGSARGQMQKLPSAGKFHCSPSAAVIRCERVANSLFLFLRPRKGRCRLLALRVVPCLAQKSVAIGGGADMDDRAAMDDGDVNDP